MNKRVRMKGRLIAGVFSALLVLVLLIGIGGCSEKSAAPEPGETDITPEKPIELTFNHLFSETSWVHETVVEWKEMVEEKSDNRLKITIYSSGSLAKPGEMYDAVKAGSIDIILDPGPYYSGRFPLSEAAQLPLLGARSSLAASRALMGLYEEFPELREEYSDTHFLWLFSQGPAQIISREPVETVEDVNGMIIRAPGAWAAPMKELGASPVDVPASECYLALSKGTVDGTLFPPEALPTWNLYEACSHMTMGNFFGQWFFVLMNHDKYNSMPAEMQEVIDECSGIVGTDLIGQAWDKADKSGYELALDEGMQIHTLKDEAQWEQRWTPVVENWINDMEDKGYPARDFVNRAKELIEKHNQELGSWQDEFGM